MYKNQYDRSILATTIRRRRRRRRARSGQTSPLCPARRPLQLYNNYITYRYIRFLNIFYNSLLLSVHRTRAPAAAVPLHFNI